jgi:2-keto-4-pentenoate hydratase/2-oxohepta-3-ene-1,7-dioic acid hydratase in catechol pathway
MRLGSLDQRAVVIDEERSAYYDVGLASEGKLSADPVGLLEQWNEFRAWEAVSDQQSWTELDVTGLGPPVPTPRQVFALAVNYADHASEARREVPEYPYVFTKFPSCIVGPWSDVVLPSNRCDWEVELVVVIGTGGHKIAAADAWSRVAGVTVGQDISERRVQFRKPIPHLSLSKSFPTFGPTGPWLVTSYAVANPDDLALSCTVDGEKMQSSRTSNMVFSVPVLVESISAITPLLPGDLIFTGTPSGTGSSQDPRRYLEPGDVIVSEIEGVGTIRNTCVSPTTN